MSLLTVDYGEVSGGGAVELEWGYKALSANEIFAVTTTKKARALVVMFPYSGQVIHYYVNVDAPNDVYYGLGTDNAIDSTHSTVFSDNSITFTYKFSSSAITVEYIIIY